MTNSIYALIVILFISGATFWILAKPYSQIFSSSAFQHLRHTWLILVTLAFVLPNFWLFIAFATVLLLAYIPKTSDQRIIYYFLLLCALPNMTAVIPGFGLIQAFFNLSYNRFLILMLLFPILLNNSQRNPHNFQLFSIRSDTLILLFISLQVVMSFRYNSITIAMRESSMLFIDIFIPYYIISRHVNSQEQFNRVLAALLVTLTILALIGLFEATKFWLLYSNLKDIKTGRFGGYDIRAGGLRVLTVFAGPIIFGYVLIIGFGLLLYLRPLLKWKYLFYLNAAIIILAELATVSRGPWLGFTVFILAYIWTGVDRISKYSQGLLILIIGIPFLSLTPFWEKFLQLLPFVGSIRSDTISYRERLFEMALIVFKRNPLFGSPTYLATPEMQSLTQGQGIIDIVNSYIHFALKYGLVGLSMFLLIFIFLTLKIYLIVKILPQENVDLIRLGRVLFAILIAILFTITTVSSIDYIPVLYWAFSGLAAGYILLARKILDKKV